MLNFQFKKLENQMLGDMFDLSNLYRRIVSRTQLYRLEFIENE